MKENKWHYTKVKGTNDLKTEKATSIFNSTKSFATAFHVQEESR